MNATWYDVLGVDPDSTADEIRAAWKQAIAELEPTDRRFRACNQAAEVLLDPERRAEYDAELAGGAAVAEQPAVVEPELKPTPEPEGEPDAVEVEAVEVEVEADETADDETEAVTGEPSPAFAVPPWLLGALAAAAAAVLVLAAVVWWAGDEPEEDVEANVVEARSAAEDALPKLISYSYKTAERDRDQALRLTTGKAHDDIEELWDEAIMPNIAEAKASASSTLVTSGVVRVSDDGDQVQIVIVLDVRSENAAVKNNDRLPFTVTMVETDGEWLVSEFKDSSEEAPAPTESSTPGP